MSAPAAAPLGPLATPGRILRTARLMLLPPGAENLPDLIRLKADEREHYDTREKTQHVPSSRWRAFKHRRPLG